MFRYNLHWADGTEAGEAEYAFNIVWLCDGRKALGLDVVPIGEKERSPYLWLLRVEAA